MSSAPEREAGLRAYVYAIALARRPKLDHEDKQSNIPTILGMYVVYIAGIHYDIRGGDDTDTAKHWSRTHREGDKNENKAYRADN